MSLSFFLSPSLAHSNSASKFTHENDNDFNTHKQTHILTYIQDDDCLTS